MIEDVLFAHVSFQYRVLVHMIRAFSLVDHSGHGGMVDLLSPILSF